MNEPPLIPSFLEKVRGVPLADATCRFIVVFIVPRSSVGCRCRMCAVQQSQGPKGPVRQRLLPAMRCILKEFTDTVFLGQKQEQKQADAEGARSALLQLQRALGLPQRAGEKHVKLMVKGVAVAARSGQVPKGTMNQKMWEDFLTWCKPMLSQEEFAETRRAVRLGVAGHLRWSEIRRLRGGDLKPESPESGSVCVLRICKTARAGKADMSEKLMTSAFRKTWEDETAGFAVGAWLFKRDLASKVRDLLETAARALEWPVARC